MLRREELDELLELAMNQRAGVGVADEIDFCILFDEKQKEINPHLALNRKEYYPEIIMMQPEQVLKSLRRNKKQLTQIDNKQIIAQALGTINPCIYDDTKLVYELQKQLFQLSLFIHSYYKQDNVKKLKRDYQRIIQWMNNPEVDKDHVLYHIDKMKSRYHKSFGEKICDIILSVAKGITHLFESIKYSLAASEQIIPKISRRVSSTHAGGHQNWKYNFSLFNEYTRRNNMEDVLNAVEKITINSRRKI